MRTSSFPIVVVLMLTGLLSTARAGDGSEDADGLRASAAPGALSATCPAPSHEALVQQVRARDVAARVAAVQALGQGGLRTPGAQQALRRHAREADAGEARHALEALGRVGNGEDVELLLRTLEEPDDELRAAAWRALQALTGVRLPPSPTRWVRWWEGQRRHALRTLPAATKEVERAVACGRDDAAARTQLAELGWIDQALVERTALRWLRAVDARLRGEGFALAAALRLGSLAGEVESALPFANEHNREAADRAAKALGLTR